MASFKRRGGASRGGPSAPEDSAKKRTNSAVLELYVHELCALYETTFPGDKCEHQESPGRVEAIEAAIRGERHVAVRDDFDAASREDLLRVHSPEYLAALAAAAADPAPGRRRCLTPILKNALHGANDDEAKGSTPFGPRTVVAAERAAGAVCAVVDEALARPRDGEPLRAFVCVRPPGHHAERAGLNLTAGGCGFCVLSNVAIAAARALATHPTARVAIFDFDIHHGSGTQDWAERADSDRLFFASVHLVGYLLPEVRTRTTIANQPLAPAWLNSGGVSACRLKFREFVRWKAQAMATFRPDLLIISAGFNAARGDIDGANPWIGDPAAPPGFDSVAEAVGLEPDDFATMTRALLDHLPDRAPVVSVLEGGYGAPRDDDPGFDRTVLVAAALAHVRALREY